MITIGIDQGSSATKIVGLDSSSKIVFSHIVEISTITQGEAVLQSPKEILDSVKSGLDELRKKFGNQNEFAIGLACQRSGVLAWDNNGVPLTDLITWRDKTYTETLNKISQTDKDLITEITTLPVLSHYAAPKVADLQKRFPNAFVGTLDSFLVFNLFTDRQFITEPSMACRTMLADPRTGNWSSLLCDIFEVDISRLPVIKTSILNLPLYKGYKLTAFLGDSQANLLSTVDKFDFTVSLGTVSSVLIGTGLELVSMPGYLSGVLKSSPKNGLEYLLEAPTNASGGVVNEIEQLMPQKFNFDQIDEIISNTNNNDLVVFAPIGGTGAPDWRYDLSEVVDGVVADPLDFVKAYIENITFFISYNLVIFAKTRGILKECNVSNIAFMGGLSSIKYLTQTIVDLTELNGAVVENRLSTAVSIAQATKGGGGGDNEIQIQRYIKPSNKNNRALFGRYKRWCEIRGISLMALT